MRSQTRLRPRAVPGLRSCAGCRGPAGLAMVALELLGVGVESRREGGAFAAGQCM